ncbi:MAG: T9SS type A sorting domain-containing protein, partial [Bacteroidia bacterium]|nr:T9SS type A sorting domain-containing protein [Bacteroidia bacterium]
AISLGGGTLSPLYIANSSDMRIYNNSINSASTSTSTSYGAISFGGSVAGGNAVNASQVYILNNAINAGAAYALSITNATGLGAILQLDHNLYYTTGASLLFLNGTTYTPATFATAKGAILGVSDLNSYAEQPTFTSLTNLTPAATNVNSWIMNGRGIQVFDLAKDIENNNRSITRETGTPDIGAYEFTPTVLPAPATAIGSIGYGGTQYFVSYGDTVGSIIWGYSGTLPSSVSLRFAPGTLISNRASSPNSNAAIDTAAHLMDAYWKVSQTGGSSFLYDIRLRYKPFQLGNIPNESDIKTANRNTSNNYSWWNNNATLTYLDTVNNVFGLDYVLDSTSFTGTTDLSVPLPVKLSNIRAAKQNTDAIITWVTASERNASQFVVERSFNRTNFERAGIVAATGNSSITNKYQFVDEKIGRLAINKTVYYRLRIVDVDGKFEYSPMVAVSFNEITKTEVGVYPNPFNSTFNVTINAVEDAKATITIVDLYGKTVKEFTDNVVKGDNVIAVDKLQNLTPGVYFVKVNAGGYDVVTKLIKE